MSSTLRRRVSLSTKHRRSQQPKRRRYQGPRVIVIELLDAWRPVTLDDCPPKAPVLYSNRFDTYEQAAKFSREWNVAEMSDPKGLWSIASQGRGVL